MEDLLKRVIAGVAEQADGPAQVSGMRLDVASRIDALSFQERERLAVAYEIAGPILESVLSDIIEV